MSAAAQRLGARRERARAATIEEIKQTALALMHEHGIAAVRFTDIAKSMDMTAPALYRYFADRDALISALIADAYDALGAAIADAVRDLPRGDITGRWMASAQAYRRWARGEPQQFALIFGLPLPDYTAPEHGMTTEAATRAMAQLTALFLDALEQGKLGPPIVCEVDPSLEGCFEAKQSRHGTPGAGRDVVIPAENHQAMLHAWSSLHGFTSLEAYGHLDWMPPEARDALFAGQVRLAALAAGLPDPALPDA
jgi:AcrR family transcriptional regulator